VKRGTIMKKNNRMYNLIPFILLTFLFSSCSTSSKNAQTPENTPITAIEDNQKMGNTNSNILNGGHSVLHDDWLYFMNFADNNFLYKTKPDGTGESKVVDDTAYFLNAYDNWLYYCNGSDNGKIIKIRLDGTDRTLVIDAKVSNMMDRQNFQDQARWDRKTKSQ